MCIEHSLAVFNFSWLINYIKKDLDYKIVTKIYPNALRKIPTTFLPFIKILYTYIPRKVIIKKIHGSRIT